MDNETPLDLLNYLGLPTEADVGYDSGSGSGSNNEYDEYHGGAKETAKSPRYIVTSVESLQDTIPIEFLKTKPLVIVAESVNINEPEEAKRSFASLTDLQNFLKDTKNPLTLKAMSGLAVLNLLEDIDNEQTPANFIDLTKNIYITPENVSVGGSYNVLQSVFLAFFHGLHAYGIVAPPDTEMTNECPSFSENFQGSYTWIVNRLVELKKKGGESIYFRLDWEDIGNFWTFLLEKNRLDVGNLNDFNNLFDSLQKPTELLKRVKESAAVTEAQEAEDAEETEETEETENNNDLPSNSKAIPVENGLPFNSAENVLTINNHGDNEFDEFANEAVDHAVAELRNS